MRFWFLSLKRERGRRGRRTKAEIEAERKELQSKVELELNTIVAEMHDLLSRQNATSIGIAYARYSTEFQQSIGDQVRAIFETAIKLGIFIPREFVFYDLAVRGCKERRPGLDRTRAVLKAKQAQTLLVLTTNRLYRKMYKCMKFVEEEVVGRGLRCIFGSGNIDTALSDRWRLPLQVNAMVDEMSSSMYGDNIRAAHIGLFLQRMVVCTLPFGYMGQDTDGSLTKKGLPRQIIVIDPETSEWVIKIFHWFVIDRLPMARILERLNDQGVPCGPKSDGTSWSHQALHYLLTNACYRGHWEYGKGQNIWQGAADYSKRVLRDKPLREAHFEVIRLVSDDTWYKAQQILAESPQKNAGRKPVDANAAKRPRDLNGLLVCKTHNGPLKVGGDYGQSMFCLKCRNMPKAKRPLYTYLNRALALRMLCGAIAESIRKDREMVGSMVTLFTAEVMSLQQGDPGKLEALRGRAEKLTRQIQFIQGNPGETEHDLAESRHRLRTLRGERAAVEAEVAKQTSAMEKSLRTPTRQEFDDLLNDLDAILLAASGGVQPEVAGALRRLLEEVTGGEIAVEQMGERRAGRGWLRLRFKLHLIETYSARFGFEVPSGSAPTEMVIDLREPTIAETHAEECKQLYDQNMLVTAIANKLGIERHQVAEGIRIAHERRGVPPPLDGRVRRAHVADKMLKPAVYQEIAGEAKRLYDEGMSIVWIAKRVGRTSDTVRHALHWWFESRGLPVPVHPNRRNKGSSKNRPDLQS